MKIVQLLLLNLTIFVSQIIANNSLNEFHGYQIPSTFYNSAIPADISFCIVDLKYNKPYLKICELGEGIESGFHGHQTIYGRNVLWNNFWDFIKNLKQQIYVIGITSHRSIRKEFPFAFDKLTSMNAIFDDSFQSLETNKQFRIINHQHKQLALRLDDSAGILIPLRPQDIYKDNARCLSKYPALLLLDNATRSIVLNKLITHLMFKDDILLEEYRPQCMIVPKRYSTEMSLEIISSIPAEFFVIKPLNAWKGRGIIFTSRNNLDITLKAILSDTILKTNIVHSQELEFWKSYEKNYFLVEAFEPSQSIKINNKKYDATMRVALGLAYDNGEIIIKFFGCYWKLPKKSLAENGSFEEKHKSHIDNKRVCSAKVDKQTEAEVYEILEKILPTVYKKMIAARYDPDFIPQVRKKINGPHSQPVLK